ncbi:hypothetical protein OKW32_001695 [Paraburkholderia youngii]
MSRQRSLKSLAAIPLPVAQGGEKRRAVDTGRAVACHLCVASDAASKCCGPRLCGLWRSLYLCRAGLALACRGDSAHGLGLGRCGILTSWNGDHCISTALILVLARRASHAFMRPCTDGDWPSRMVTVLYDRHMKPERCPPAVGLARPVSVVDTLQTETAEIGVYRSSREMSNNTFRVRRTQAENSL